MEILFYDHISNLISPFQLKYYSTFIYKWIYLLQNKNTCIYMEKLQHFQQPLKKLSSRLKAMYWCNSSTIPWWSSWGKSLTSTMWIHALGKATQYDEHVDKLTFFTRSLSSPLGLLIKLNIGNLSHGWHQRLHWVTPPTGRSGKQARSTHRHFYSLKSRNFVAIKCHRGNIIRKM